MAQKITKAVVPVGGWATRFLPAVKTYAKHLIPVVDRPQLQWVIEELLGAGIDQLCIVYREGDNTIPNYFQPNPALDEYLKSTGKQDKMDSWNNMMSHIKHIEFLPQTKDFPYGNGVPLLVAEKFINNEPIVYLWGDDLTFEDTPGNFVRSLISIYDQYTPDVITSVQEVPDWQVPALGMVKFANDTAMPERITDIIEKPKLEDAPSHFGQCARFIVTPQVLEVLKTQQTSRGELWFTDAVNTLAHSGTALAVKYNDYGAKWSACGDPLTWLQANITLALRDPKYADPLRDFIKSL